MEKYDYNNDAISHVLGFSWLLIMSSGFDDWVYWHFFTVTINYYSSHTILTAEASLRSASRSTADLNDMSHESPRRISDWSLLKWKSKSHCDWRSVSQSVSLGVEPHLRLMARYLLLFDSYGRVCFFLWVALSDERTGLSFVRVIACISKSFVIM
jgi:hypothetical protein